MKKPVEVVYIFYKETIGVSIKNTSQFKFSSLFFKKVEELTEVNLLCRRRTQETIPLALREGIDIDFVALCERVEEAFPL
jgi:hypothetical protein